LRKPGLALSDIDGFPTRAVKRLRTQLSVTTADEFLDLWKRFRSSLDSVLDVDATEAERLAGVVARAQAAFTASPDKRAAAEAEPAGGAGAYPYRTGLDAPPEGREVFDDVKWEKRGSDKEGTDA
jgi:hypothetical protein